MFGKQDISKKDIMNKFSLLPAQLIRFTAELVKRFIEISFHL
jgi:hypothetical protein